MLENNHKIFNNNNINNNFSNKNGYELNNENYLSSIKMESISPNSQIKILNDTINTLNNKLSNYEIEKNKILLSSNENDKYLKEIKQKLYQTKSEVEKLKQIINQKENKNKNNISIFNPIFEDEEYHKNNEEYQKNSESNLIKLQSKIIDLKLQLNKKKNKFRFFSPTHKNILLSPLKNSKNISLFIPSFLNKGQNRQNLSELCLTGTDETSETKNSNIKEINYLNEVKQDNNSVGKGEIKIETELKKLKNENNNLLKLLKNKNEEINDKLEQQNKLSKNLIETLDRNKKIRNIFRIFINKNKKLENEKKLLEDIILKQENKVIKLSKSYKNAINMMNDKKEEINRNKNYIFNLEETIKKYKKTFENINNNEKKKINELEMKIKNNKDENNNQTIFNGSMTPENNYGNNIYNKIYQIDSPRSPDYYRIKYKLLMNPFKDTSSLNSFNLKLNKNRNKKFLINNYSDKNKNNFQKIFNNNINYKLYNKNRINVRTRLLKHNKSTFEIKREEKTISIDNSISNHSLNANKRIINFREAKREKEKREDFKSFFNKYIKDN